MVGGRSSAHSIEKTSKVAVANGSLFWGQICSTSKKQQLQLWSGAQQLIDLTDSGSTWHLQSTTQLLRQLQGYPSSKHRA